MPTEDLVINMRANDQLSVTLKKVGAAAEDAGKSIQKVTAADVANFGRSMLRGATELATGLYGLAKASSDVVEQQNFVKQVFGNGGPQIEAFAKKAAQAVGLSEAAALQAAASLGIFGRAVGMTGPDLASFSDGLVQLAGDMASVKNTSVESAVTAIGAAFRSQYRPIKQYGVVLNEQVLQHRALELGIGYTSGKLTQQQKVLAIQAELYDQLDFAVGDFARTQDTLANQTRIAEANFTNLKASLGEALMPAFVNITHAANSAMQAFMKLPDPIKQTAANIALLGTGMLAIGGGVLFAVGKIGGMINSFRDLRSSMQAIQTSGSSTQKTMLGIGKAAAGIGLAAAGIQIAFDGINAITGTAKKAEDAVAKLNIALAKGSKVEAWSGFLDMAKQEDDATKWSHLWTDAGKKIQLMGSNTKRPIEDLDAAFSKLLSQDPNQASKILDIMSEQASHLDKTGGQYKDNTMLIERWQKQLDLSVGSLQATGKAADLSADTLADHGDAALIAAAADEEAQKAAEELATYMDKLADSVVNTDKAFDSASERADAFKDALDQATGVSDSVTTMVAYKDALAKMGDAWKDDKGHIDKAKMSLDWNTQAGRDNIDAIDGIASAMNDNLLTVYKQSGGSMAAVTEAQKGMVDQYDEMLRAAGASDEQIQKFNRTLNETPEDLTIAIHLENQEVAMKKLDMLNIEFDKLPPEVVTAITAEMDEGDFVTAYQLASNFVNGRPLSFGMEADDPTTSVHEGLNTAQAVANANPVNVPMDAKPVPQNSLAGIINNAMGFFAKNKPTTEIDVKPGDVQTPQGKNIAYAKSNVPKTEIETDPGDYKGPKREIDNYMKANDPVTTVKTEPGPYTNAWAQIMTFYATHPAYMYANVQVGDVFSAWSAIRMFFALRPVTVMVNADDGNVGAAWGSIQSYFNSHPITVRVNTVAGSTAAAPTAPRSAGQPPGRAQKKAR